jgi:hypothetical protein
LGELKADAETIISRVARAISMRPRRMYSTPTARLPSSTMRLASARVVSVTLRRFIAGRR